MKRKWFAVFQNGIAPHLPMSSVNTICEGVRLWLSEHMDDPKIVKAGFQFACVGAGEDDAGKAVAVLYLAVDFKVQSWLIGAGMLKDLSELLDALSMVANRPVDVCFCSKIPNEVGMTVIQF